MAEPDKRQIGDGQDNYGQAIQQLTNASKQFGQRAAEQTAQRATEAAANAAAASVQVGVETGKAVSEVAVGTAAAGPWGAILSAAWAMRHTLFKALVCVCFVVLFFVILIVSLPTIVSNSVFGLDGVKPLAGASLEDTYSDLAVAVADVVGAGYDASLARVEEIIEDGGYDYEQSMDSVISNAQTTAGYDVCYILAAYSASLQQQNVSKDDMLQKLSAVADQMFQVTYEEHETEVPAEDPEEGTVTITYIQATIASFNNEVVAQAFGIDLTAEYPQFGITYAEAIKNMANALKMTLYGTLTGGESIPLTDEKLINFVNQQQVSDARKHLLTTALSLVGKVPYFWGGKSPPGWNDEWNTPKLVTAAGSVTTGTIRPFGLDCSGFVDWAYKTALGVNSLSGGTWHQWDASTEIDERELLPGDLGFLKSADGSSWDHVLIFAGYGEDGARQWVHSTGGSGVTLNTPTYDDSLYFARPNHVDFSGAVTDEPYGTPLYSLEVDVTHYCACTKCCGENAMGITASGKAVDRGMVAMSSYYPFGTLIMINGTMYTVEDRGGRNIENDISRVDIYIPDHQEALRLGRYQTTAEIYRMGR